MDVKYECDKRNQEVAKKTFMNKIWRMMCIHNSRTKKYREGIIRY